MPPPPAPRSSSQSICLVVPCNNKQQQQQQQQPPSTMPVEVGQNDGRVLGRFKRIRLPWAIYTCTFISCFIIAGVLLSIDRRQTRYSIIFDARSAGSRMHLFKLEWRAGLWFLLGEYFERSAPGIGFYGEAPRQAAKSLSRMLRNATRKIPTSYHHVTRLSLGATTALTELANNRSALLLNTLRKLFYGKATSSFQNGTVDILGGLDKGFYSWAALSFLLNETLPESTVASLELGNATAQVAFRPPENGSLNERWSPSTFRLLDIDIALCVNNADDTGLFLARDKILRINDSDYQSPCMAEKLPAEETYQAPTLQKASSSSKLQTSPHQVNYTSCYFECLEVVKQSAVEAVPPLPGYTLFATGQFYSLAAQVGMIPKTATRGTISPDDFKRQAQTACELIIDVQDTLCVDLTYVYALLNDGYMLPGNTTINVVRQISGIDVGWPLGMALSQLYG